MKTIQIDEKTFNFQLNEIKNYCGMCDSDNKAFGTDMFGRFYLYYTIDNNYFLMVFNKEIGDLITDVVFLSHITRMAVDLDLNLPNLLSWIMDNEKESNYLPFELKDIVLAYLEY